MMDVQDLRPVDVAMPEANDRSGVELACSRAKWRALVDSIRDRQSLEALRR